MRVGDRVEIGEGAEHDIGEVIEVVSGPGAGIDGESIVRVRWDRADATYVETSASLRIVPARSTATRTATTRTTR